jgi:hypothetical protein
MRGMWPGQGSKAREEKDFFFEKKKQKTFARLVPRKLMYDPSCCRGAGAKAFWFFFSKNNTSSCELSSLCCGAPLPPGILFHYSAIS